VSTVLPLSWPIEERGRAEVLTHSWGRRARTQAGRRQAGRQAGSRRRRAAACGVGDNVAERGTRQAREAELRAEARLDRIARHEHD